MYSQPRYEAGACGGHQDDIVALAVRAIAILAAKEKGRGCLGASESERVQEFCDASINPDEKRRYAIISKMIASGISTIEIVERYVPLAAMRLGQAWVDGTCSFSQVSIGAVRLQETVRALGERKCGVTATIPLGHRVLIAIPAHEDHTLGAFIAAAQFRRYGLWVHMAIGQDEDEIAAAVKGQRFEMIGVSGAGRKALEPIKRLVDKLKQTGVATSPIVIGGNICNLGLDLCSRTGADYATTSPRKAMDLCGLEHSSEQDAPGAMVA